MSSGYALGAAFERRTMAALETDGYEVFRSAGSHGKSDVIAIKQGQVLLIQCKRSGKIDRAEWNELVRLRQALDPRGGTVLALLAYMPGARGGVAFRELLHQLEHKQRRDNAYRMWTTEGAGSERSGAGAVGGSEGGSSRGKGVG
jgi:Holliday junction resolvase